MTQPTPTTTDEDALAAESGSPGRDKASGGGESAGGAYPNPHSGTSEDTVDGKKAFDDDWGGSAGVGHHGGGDAGQTHYTDDEKG